MDHLMNLNVIIERVSANRHKGAKSQSCHERQRELLLMNGDDLQGHCYRFRTTHSAARQLRA